jgi:hypothetical protein
MRRNTILMLVSSTLIIATLACSISAPTPAPNVNATVDAAIQATSMAELAINATVSAAVAATAAAATPVPTVNYVEPTPTAESVEPVPTTESVEPVPTTEYVEMTEEELAALIDQAVAEATAASQQCSTATMETTADGAVTQEEVVYIYEYYYYADEAIAYAEELIEAYYYYYGDLATETIAVLYQIEEDLETLAESIALVNEILLEISTTLEQGLAVTEEVISQLETAAQAALTHAAEAQARTDGMVENLHAAIEDRATTVLATRLTDIPTDLPTSIQAGFQYLDTVRGGMDDNRITQDELKRIAELGANAAAGFTQFGGPQLSHLSEAIHGQDGITANLARGRNSQAKAGLGNLEMSLGERPSLSGGGSGGVGPGGGSSGGVGPGGGSPGGIGPSGGSSGGIGPGGGSPGGGSRGGSSRSRP